MNFKFTIINFKVYFYYGKKNSESDYRLLPSYILSTRSVLNPINQDLKSFGHAIVFAHHPTDWNATRGQPAKEERLIQHGLDKMKYPVLPSEIPNLDNQLRMRINFFLLTTHLVIGDMRCISPKATS